MVWLEEEKSRRNFSEMKLFSLDERDSFCEEKRRRGEESKTDFSASFHREDWPLPQYALVTKTSSS